MTPIKLPVRIEKRWDGERTRRMLIDADGFEPHLSQIAAALNATAPGQIPGMVDLSVEEKRAIAKHKWELYGDAAPGQAAEEPEPDEPMSDFQRQIVRDYGTTDRPRKPAGEQRRCRCGDIKGHAGWLNCEPPIGPQPAETAPTYTREGKRWSASGFPVFSSKPTDPGEELRLLKLLERRCRTAHSPDIDCAEDLLLHMRNAIDPVLDQLDALRAAREGRS